MILVISTICKAPNRVVHENGTVEHLKNLLVCLCRGEIVSSTERDTLISHRRYNVRNADSVLFRSNFQVFKYCSTAVVFAGGESISFLASISTVADLRCIVVQVCRIHDDLIDVSKKIASYETNTKNGSGRTPARKTNVR